MFLYGQWKYYCDSVWMEALTCDKVKLPTFSDLLCLELGLDMRTGNDGTHNHGCALFTFIFEKQGGTIEIMF